jgi:hypothetical protein
MSLHTDFSAYRERLIEHLLVSELLKISWHRGDCSLEISQPEVDSSGYDVIAEAHGVIRHIQLKTTVLGSTTTSHTVQLALGSKPSGCVVVVFFQEESLALGPFLFFGGMPGEPLPSLQPFKVAKNVRANAQGLKTERPNHRVVPNSAFQKIATIEALYGCLFGTQPSVPPDPFTLQACGR